MRLLRMRRRGMYIQLGTSRGFRAQGIVQFDEIFLEVALVEDPVLAVEEMSVHQKYLVDS